MEVVSTRVILTSLRDVGNVEGCFQFLELLGVLLASVTLWKWSVPSPHWEILGTHYQVRVLFMVTLFQTQLYVWRGRGWNSHLSSSTFSLLKVTFWNSQVAYLHSMFRSLARSGTYTVIFRWPIMYFFKKEPKTDFQMWGAIKKSLAVWLNFFYVFRFL